MEVRRNRKTVCEVNSMSEQMLLEARMPAKARKPQVGQALQRALNMPFIRTMNTVRGGIGQENAAAEESVQPTYRGENLSRAALNQVKFKPGQSYAGN